MKSSVLETYSITKHWEPLTETKVFLIKAINNLDKINLEIIPDDQIKSISNYHRRMDRDKRLISRSFLFEYCREFFGLKDFRFSLNEFKMPSFLNSKVQFSFSYSKDYMLIGISTNKMIGVDIEYKDPRSDFEGIAETTMNDDELDHFRLLTGHSRLCFFYNIWSNKEALVKALGEGLYYPIVKINLMKAVSGEVMINDRTYHLIELRGENNFSMCLAYSSI